MESIDKIESNGNGSVNQIRRRRSSLFPQYLRTKSLSGRKDSTFASDSTKKLYPFQVDDKQPDPKKYGASQPDSNASSFKFGWVNGVYVSSLLKIQPFLSLFLFLFFSFHKPQLASLYLFT